jgi:hypothetical protein
MKTRGDLLQEQIKKKSAGADGGSCPRVWARLTLRLAPHWHQQTFVSACVYEGGQKCWNISGDAKYFSKNKKKSYLFCDLKPYTTYDSPFLEKSNSGGEKKERE